MLARAAAAVFGPLPKSTRWEASKSRDRTLNSRWRIGWAVGGLTLLVISLVHVAFSAMDHAARSRTASAGRHVPRRPPAFAARAQSVADAGADAPKVPVNEVDFGFDRDTRTVMFVVTAPTAEAAGQVSAEQFAVLADDGHDAPDFARVVQVDALTGGQVRVLLAIDASCHAAITGGTFSVQTVYRGPVTLDTPRLDTTVRLQSRWLLYSIALIPAIIVLAMFQAFTVWPVSIKRWFTSVIAIGVPTLTAFRVAGLDDGSWRPDAIVCAALIGVTYTAAVTAANLVKNGGHDLDDGSMPSKVLAAEADPGDGGGIGPPPASPQR